MVRTFDVTDCSSIAVEEHRIEGSIKLKFKANGQDWLNIIMDQDVAATVSKFLFRFISEEDKVDLLMDSEEDY